MNDAGDAYLFNVPTLGASQSLHIVTPSYFDGSIALSVQTLSQGSAGDTAISEAVTQTLTVLSQGDGVDLKVGSATGVEDSPVPVRLPISVTRKDVSEEIADVTLSLVTAEFGDAVDAISYVSRVETRMTDIAVTVDAGLVASDARFTDAAALRVDPATGEVDASSAKQVAFADLSDVSLVVRAAPGYGQKVPDLKGQTLAQIEDGFSGEVYGYFLRGTYELEDGTAVEAVFGARFEDGAFVDDTDVGLFAFQQSVGNSFADLAPDGVDPFVTASQNSDDELKTDFVIDIAAAAEALAGEDATSAEQIAAQLWLTRNIGVKPAEDVDGEVVVGVAVRTRDSGNLGTDPAEDAGVSTASTGQITVDIESRADAVAIAAEAEGVLSAPIESAEVSSSADGIELLSTDGDGLFSGISAAGGGAVDNSQFDGLIIGVTLDAGASSQTAVLADLSQIALEVRAADPGLQVVVVNEFTPKLNDAGDAYLFNVPTLGASHSLHIVTPSYFDGSIELSVQTLSQGSAGDTAISEAVTQTLTVLSQGDGVDLKVGSATGVEDSPVPVRLPISVTRKDVSEEIADVTLSLVTAEFGDAVDAISYVSRVETRMTDIAVTVDAGLVASDATFTDAAALRVDPATGEVDASSAKQVAFADLSDVSLVVRAAPGYGQKVPDLKGKTLAQIEDGFSGEVYGYFLRGTYELEDGTEVEAVFGARLEDGAFVDDTDVGLFAFQQSVGNSFADLAPDGVDPFVTASQNSDDELKTDFVIDIAAAAEALAGSGATQAQKIEAQLWLTRNIGVKPAENLFGELTYDVSVRTRDSGNLGDTPAEGAGVSDYSKVSTTMSVTSINDLPEVDTTTSDSSYFFNNEDLHPELNLTDIDNANFKNGSLRVDISSEVLLSENEKVLVSEEGILETDTRDSDVILLALVDNTTVEIGIFDPSSTKHSLIVNFNENATIDLVQELLRSIQYSNLDNHVAEPGVRTITVALQDGAGPNAVGERSVIIERDLTVFKGVSGDNGENLIKSSAELIDNEETLVGGTGADVLIGDGNDIINLELEREFAELFGISQPELKSNPIQFNGSGDYYAFENLHP